MFNAATFSETGFELIERTHSLQQIVARNSTLPEAVHVSFACDSSESQS